MASDGGSEAVAHVIRCLQNCLYAVDNDSRKNAEQQLEAGVHHPGFASTLAALATDPALTNNDIGVRQLAAVLLKQLIKKHWSAEAPKFQPPELPREERARVQAALPAGLADASSKVRTAVAMCIAAVSKVDPDGWPGLLENLVGAIHAQRTSNTPLVHGAIRCLSLLSDDIDEQKLPQVARALVPELLPVASGSPSGPSGSSDPCASSTTPEELRAAALSIFHDMLKSLAVMSGVYQRQVRDLLVPLADPWVPLLCNLVAAPLDAEDPSGWSLRLLSLKCLTQLVSYFGRALQPHSQTLLQAAWRMFSSCLGVYQTYLVLEPSEGGAAGTEGGPAAVCEGAVDAEGDTLDLEALLAQLFELLLALVGAPRFARLIRPALQEMAYMGVVYMQMTAQQASEWCSNPAAYVADEEDSTFTVRVSGELLVDSLVQAFGTDGAVAIMDAVERRMGEAAGAAAAGQAGWWKLREAALLAAGCCCGSVFPRGVAEGLNGSGRGAGRGGAGGRERASSGALAGRLQGLVDEVLRSDLQSPSLQPLLLGRALWLAARLQPLLRPDQRPALLAAAAAGLNSNLPPPVKIGACRALSSLCPRLPVSSVGPLAESLYGGLLGLLGECGEEALNLVLESLVPLIKADPSAAARALPALSTPVLQVWSRYVNDPLISEGALEVLAALARLPPCLGTLAAQVVPVAAGVLGRPEEQAPGLVEGCLDLLGRLVRPGQPDVVAAVSGSCGGPLLGLLPGGPHAGADDASGALTHGATELLVELLRAGREDLLTWAAPSLSSASSPSSSPTCSSCPSQPSPPSSTPSPDAVFAALLSATHHLLDPAADEHRTCLAGDMAAALVRWLPSRAAVQPVLGGLLAACCAKLAVSNLSMLVGGLLSALGAMACVGGAGAWVEALAGVTVTPAGGGHPTSGLQVVLPVLLDRLGDVRGRLALKGCVAALLGALRSRHPLLMSFTVRVQRQDLASGVRTRRQAAEAGGDQWTVVPVAVRLAAVVAEAAVDQPWEEELEAEDDDDEDSDEVEWEEEGDGSEDDEEEEEGEAAGAGAGVADQEEDLQDLKLAGRGIGQAEQASLDAHIDRSPTLSADSAAVSYGAHYQDDHTDPLSSLDLRVACLEALAELQAGGPDTAWLLGAAVELLPGRKQQQLGVMMAGGRGSGAGGA